MTRRSNLTELTRSHGLTTEAANLVELWHTASIRDAGEALLALLALLLRFSAEGVIVCDVLRSLRSGRGAATAVRPGWTHIAGRRLRGLLLLAIKVLCLQHLLVLHPCKLILLLMLLMLLLLLGVHVWIVTGRGCAKRLRLKLTAKHGYLAIWCCVEQEG